jgi:hypothetical protein
MEHPDHLGGAGCIDFSAPQPTELGINHNPSFIFEVMVWFQGERDESCFRF